jgi:hypothetical protein
VSIQTEEQFGQRDLSAEVYLAEDGRTQRGVPVERF